MKFSGYCFYVNTKLYGDFQICISVSLKNWINTRNWIEFRLNELNWIKVSIYMSLFKCYIFYEDFGFAVRKFSASGKFGLMLLSWGDNVSRSDLFLTLFPNSLKSTLFPLCNVSLFLKAKHGIKIDLFLRLFLQGIKNFHKRYHEC